jgi:hypothetical protein
MAVEPLSECAYRLFSVYVYVCARAQYKNKQESMLYILIFSWYWHGVSPQKTSYKNVYYFKLQVAQFVQYVITVCLSSFVAFEYRTAWVVETKTQVFWVPLSIQ